MSYFKIDGYWKDDQSEFNGLIVSDSQETKEDIDWLIFYYGLSEKLIKEAIILKENTVHDFVITSFKETQEI